MFKRSAVPQDTIINSTNSRVQTAGALAPQLIPVGRATIGSAYKESLIFEDDDLTENLISIPRLDDEGCRIIIENGKMSVSKNKIIIMEADKKDGLYEFDLDGTETALLADVKTMDRLTELRRIHHRTGHRNLLRINKYIKNKTLQIEQFPGNVSDRELQAMPTCDACAKAKFTKLRRHRTQPKEKPATGEHLSTDMKGPISTAGTNGERYYQGFLDAHSKYLSFKCFKYKSDALTNLKATMAEPPFSGRLRRYHADGAPELISKETVETLRAAGVIVSYSAPYKSPDNAGIERSHRTIFECAHAMLLHACLPTIYWCYAVAHAVYLYNHIPTNTGAGYMAPVTAVFGTAANLSSEITFGAHCYVIIPAETRPKGFTEKSSKGTYLGHRSNGSPGYYILMHATNEVKICSDVSFDESDLDSGERAAKQQPVTTLEVAPICRELQDFMWLVGMAYRDEGLLYITTRVVVVKKFIVTFRAPVVSSKIGTEEHDPVHAADVVLLMRDFLAANDPILSAGESAVIELGVDEKESAATDPGEVPEEGEPLVLSGDSHAGITNGPGGKRPAGDQPSVAIRDVTAAAGQGSSTGRERSAIVPTTPRDSAVSKRSRTVRVPLNIGVMGNIERVFSINEYDIEYTYALSDSLLDTTSDSNPDMLLFDDVLGAPDGEREKWLAAGRDELISIVRDNDTWIPCDLPAGVKALTTKWVFKRKKERGKPDRYKARLCVRGFEQREGLDYGETYAPTAKWVTLRLFLTICSCLNMFTRQLDVKTAFLYAPLDEDIYIQCPKGVELRTNIFELPEDVKRKCRGRYLKLLKSLYGLKQAPRNWYDTLKGFLLEMGFQSILSDACIFFKYVDGRLILAIVFVDDILLGAASKADLKILVDGFSKRFKIKDSGEVDVYLSIHVERDWTKRTMALDQTDYIKQMWRTFQGQENLRVTTPFVEGWRINIEEELLNESDEDRAFAASFPYRELVGSLLFIQICTRGDICYNVHYLARFNNKPCKSACLAGMRVLQFLYNTKHRKLILGGVERPLLTLFCDTDFAACEMTRKSVECYLLYMGLGCIMWCVKQQGRVAQSTGEAEFIAMTPGCNMVVWIRSLLSELRLGYIKATATYTDNETARILSENPTKHSTMKQISIKYLMIRQLRALNIIVGGRVGTDVNPADLGTKPLGVRELTKKSNTFFDGIGDLAYTQVERPTTILNDEYV